MKLKFFTAFSLIFCIVFFGAGAFGGVEPTSRQPSAVAPESKYAFDPVIDGTEITHDFVIQNKGNALLKIERVKTG